VTRSRLSATGGTGQPTPGSGAGWPGQGAPVPGHVPVPPALVNLVLTGCKPGFPAYHATILDLAARGFLTVTSQPDDIWLGYDADAAASADTAALAGYEQMVLGDMSRRLAGTGGAPFRVLAGACQADEQNVWRPFTEALCAEARRRGLSQRHRPSRRTVAGWTAFAAVATLFGSLAVIRHLTLAGAAGCSVAVALVVLVLVAATSRRDRLTPYGTELAARFAGEHAALIGTPAMQGLAISDAELGRRAVAVAAMIPGAGPEPGTPGRRRGPAAPAQAWSAFSGTWRLVTIGPPPQNVMIPAEVRLAFTVWFALIAMILAVKADTRLWSLPFVLVAIGLGVRGHARLAAALSQPRRRTFTGQVIARWGDAGNEEHPYCAVDDGERAWAFTAPAVCYVMLDDLVQVTLNLRTGKLITLQVTERLRQHNPGDLPDPRFDATPSPAACVVSAAEVESLIGPVRRSTPVPVLGGHGVLYQGRDGTVRVTVVSGHTARLAAMISRSAGTLLPGTGAEFWLPDGGRAVAVRSGGTVASVMVSGRGAPRRPDLLTELAAKIAARLELTGSQDAEPESAA
jgi:hypothetical protein